MVTERRVIGEAGSDSQRMTLAELWQFMNECEATGLPASTEFEVWTKGFSRAMLRGITAVPPRKNT